MSATPPDSRTARELTRAEELFHSALDRPPAERDAFLVGACRGDSSLILEARALLAAHERAGDFLEPALSAELGAEMERLKPETAGERVGPYKLLQQIGQGGFGTVWMAEQEQPVRRRVALKITKLGMDTREVIARFEQERQALAMIAHQKGIIHRDLKPSNMLVTLHDGVPVPKVIDFGVAKATQQQRLTDLTVYTHYEQMIGTPLYVSPEQAEMSGLDIDTRSDIYSLGVLLYELLTGRTPFDPEELMKTGL